MDSCGKDLSTAEEIVDDLRSRYGKYARMSRQTLVLNVRNVLNARNNNKKQRAGGGKMKKQRRRLDDEKEERAHVKEKSAYSYSSSSEYDGGHISTADLTSDMLRGSYATKMNNSSTKLAPPPPPLSGGNNKVGPTFKDFAGIKKVLDELDQYILLGKPPSGILFHGPPGCGKTRLANAVANEAGVPFYQISATQVLSGVPELQVSGDSPDDDRSWLRQPWSDEDLDKLFVRMSDFEEAVKLVKGSLTREGFSTVPDVSWDDVGGLDHLRTQLKDYVVNPIKYPETFEKFGGKNLETGFLLYGPPGCGKTLVAKAVANEAGANFIYIKGPELLNKYVGESERAIRTLFQRARTSSPCVVFFDEVDALTARRGREGDWVVGGLLNQFLTELHGGDRRDVYVIGATNRLDVIDPAFLRPGRFGNLVYVPLPNADDRVSILKSIANKRPLDPSVDLDAIAYKYCQGFSGADLANLMDKAIHVAVKEKFQSIESSEDGAMDLSDCTIKMTHFKQALSLVTPSVSKQQIKHYEEQRDKLQRSTGRNNMDQINVGPSFAHE
ncbi:hypothetical protein Bca52824_043413 [Brassica carinata]|uniref:AAA+ ATPase domain-containing protein n=1 Tax=Brassica carinata TaxID=52824 RepID=A0A8X7UZQ3_BRACI|nr:hypothetical protein Bca52824_043413 [Brassica carinata]